MIKNYKFLTKVAMLLLTFLIPLAGWGQTYEMTTSLVAGDEVVLVNTSVTKELGPLSTTATVYGTAVDVENSTPVGSNLLTVAAGSAEGSFAFKTSDDKYLSWSSGNSLTTADDVTDASSWTITFDDEGNATVANVGTTARILSYNSGSPRFACYGNTNQQRVKFYKKEAAAPTDAPSISADNVNIAYDATEGEIAYTLANAVDGGSMSASKTSDWLTLSGTNFDSPIAFTCSANEGAERTATVTLTYSYGDNESVTKNVTVTQAGNPNAPGTENNPYTVAQARAAIDANTGVTGVYAKGIVSGIVTAFDSQYGNISYNISTDGTTTADQLQAYRGKSYGGANFTSANDIQVGDEVVVYGNLKKYNDTYEFDQNNQLVSLNRPVYIEVSSYGEELLAGASGSTTVTVTYKGIDPETFDIAWFDQTGADAQESDWLLAEINSTDDPEVYELTYVFDENTSTEARAAYFKVVALDNDAQLVESPLITVTQAGFVQEYDVFFVLENDETFVPNSDFETVLETVPAGTYTLPSAKKEGKVLTGWNDGTTTTAPGATYQVESDVYFYPVWKDKGVEEWVLTSIDELEEGDVFVIVGNNGSDYAMTNDNGASAPLPVAVTVEDEKITSEVADNMMWNISGDATNGYTFLVNGDSEKWLYCSTTAATGSNNNMRVGTGDRKTFILDGGGYLVTKDNNVARYLSIYVNSGTPQDWRGYINTNSAVAIAFYKKVETYPASTVKLTIRENFTATTFSSDKALDFSGFETINAYIITDGEGTIAQVSKVPAGEGLYVVGEAGDYDVPILVNETEADPVTGNKLIPTDGTTEFKSDESVTYYVFGKQNGKEAFYKVPTSGYTPSANKAVLAIDAVNGAKEMIVIGGDVTGIESIENGTIVNDNYYTIDGKLVKGQPTQKGIYVVNGRKVVIK